MNTPNQPLSVQKSDFFGTPIQIIDHNGQRWITAEQAGLALGYNEANARIGISNLYSRNKDEFTEADTFVINLITNPQGGNPNTRIFSATGCQLLGFFSNTKRAKDFRAWAKHVLAQENNNVLLLQAQLTESKQLNHRLKDKLMTNTLNYRRVYRYLERGFTTTEIASCMKVTTRSIRMIQAEMRELGLLPEHQAFTFAHTGRIARTINKDVEV